MDATAINDGNELIRILMKLDDMRGSCSVRLDQTDLFVGTTSYHFAPGVVKKLIDSKWLIPVPKSDGYQFDHDRDDEWVAAEDARMNKARAVLAEQHPSISFQESCFWGVYHHPKSADMDSRGFVFTDTHGFEYLVCEGGRVAHPLRKKVALQQQA